MKSARREIIDKLKKAQIALPEKPDFEKQIFHKVTKPYENAFKERLESVNGNVRIFNSEKELFRNMGRYLENSSHETICCPESEIREKLYSHGIPHSACTIFSDKMEWGITSCEFLIARSGSVLVSSALSGGRQISIFPEKHLVIAQMHQLKKSLEEAFAGITEKYGQNLPSQLLLITGPSRTADIEKTLTLGAHGPKELHVFLYRV